MQVDNPNRFSITVADMDYEVYINDRLVGKGRIEHEIEIPSGGQVVAELPAEISTDGLDRLVEKILKKEIKYRVKGQVVFKTFLGSYTLPFDKEKEIKKKNALLPAPAEAPGP
jgi:LEA14-like dessication related protein